MIKPRPLPTFNESARTSTGFQIMGHRLDLLKDVRDELAALLADADRLGCGPELRERLTAMHQHIVHDGACPRCADAH